jgi:hypothetical protein
MFVRRIPTRFALVLECGDHSPLLGRIVRCLIGYRIFSSLADRFVAVLSERRRTADPVPEYFAGRNELQPNDYVSGNASFFVWGNARICAFLAW